MTAAGTWNKMTAKVSQRVTWQTRANTPNPTVYNLEKRKSL